MSNKNFSLRSALLLGAAVTLSLTTSSFAQETTETVIVTGSRIPMSSNLSSVSPIQTVTSADFQYKGATDAADMLNDLPQTFISNTSDFTNQSNPLSTPGGVTTINLRGLGATRTLVLINGRRLGVGDPNTGNPGAAPDLDQIPTTLIDRVEVLTGGASSTYGSDAVAGVVNFVMKQDFEGIQVDGHWGLNWHSNGNKFAQDVLKATLDADTQGPIHIPNGDVFDGRTIDMSLMIGANTADGKGNVTGYVVYRNADPVWQSNRDFSECQINIEDGGEANRIDGAYCSGSSNSNYFKQQTGAGAPVYSVSGHSLLRRPVAGSAPPSSFNSNEYMSLGRQDSRYSAGFFAHYDVDKWLKPYSEFMFMNDRSFQQIAPGAVFRGSNAFSADQSGNWFTNCDNPLLSAQQVNLLCNGYTLDANNVMSAVPNPALVVADPDPVTPGNQGYVPIEIGRRNIEGGGRYSNYEHMNYRGVVGIRGDIFDAWHYDVFGSYYYVTVDQFNGNYLSNTKLNRALDVVNVGGVATCRSVLDGSDGACIPYNIWTEGGVTAAQAEYLSSFGTSRGTLFEEVIEADITGDLGAYGITSPFARDGVQIAVGATNRKDKMYFQGDVAESSNDLVGFGGAAVSVNNAINVSEFYGELRVPLAQSKPFFEDLSVEAGIRFSSYSNHRKPTTWKVGMQWSPISDIRLRASYDVAIRAASILESFTPQTVTNTSVVSEDPCAPPESGGPATATLAQCALTGVTAAQYGNGGTTNTISQCPSGQCAVLYGGNPDLSPEKAKTFSIGLTATPTLVPGLVASIDYYKIDVFNGIIQGIPIDVTLTNCLNTGDPRFCGLIRRTPTGNLFGTTIGGGGYIVSTFVNSGFFNNSGIDFQADYQLGLDSVGLDGYGAVSFHMVGTYTMTFKTQTISTEPVYDCAGLYGNTCGSPLPRWRHQFRTTWDTPWDVGMTLTWRFMGGSSFESNSDQPVIGGACCDRFNDHIAPFSYFDLAFTWQVTKELQLRAGMTNIFDKDPPIISNLITGTGTPNTFNNYDLLGRTMFAAFTAKL